MILTWRHTVYCEMRCHVIGEFSARSYAEIEIVPEAIFHSFATAMHLAGIFIYPVKSLRGVAVSTARLDELGLVGDRRFLIVDEEGRHLTQRPLPRMALISTELSADHLTLKSDGAGSISVPLKAGTAPTRRTVSIWRSRGLQADDCGADASHWLSDFLGVRCHLVRIGDQFHRPVLQKLRPDFPAPEPGAAMIEDRLVTSDLVNFADGYPLLVISDASLADLNDRILERGAEPVPMNRFRPNLVVTGCRAFSEDTWPRVRIGKVVLRAGGPSARCIITTTDQSTGERTSKEPLATLATYRRDSVNPTDVNFGQNFVNETKSGQLRVGDAVLV